jgi:hypothetical protein
MTIHDHNLSGLVAREQRAKDRLQIILVALALNCVLWAAILGVIRYALR